MAKFEDELTWGFSRLDQLRNQYAWRAVEKEYQNFDVQRVDLLLRNAQAWLKTTISVELVEVPVPDGSGQALLGAWTRLADGTYKVAVRAGLNRCWKRFVSCKELCHAIIDKPEYHNLEVEPHVDEMTVGSREQPGMAVMCEELAEIVAMEFLFPFELRRAALAKVVDGDFMPIAQQYLVPKLMVEKYLSTQQLDRIEPFRKPLKKVA